MIRNLLFFLGTAVSLAAAARNDEPVLSPTIIQSFQQRFKAADDVRWQRVEGMYKARFWKSGQFVQAFFSETGELLATSRKVSPLKLPVVLQAPLKDFPHHWVEDATELYLDGDIRYVVTLRSGDETVVLRSSGAAWKTDGKTSRRQQWERLLLP